MLSPKMICIVKRCEAIQPIVMLSLRNTVSISFKNGAKSSTCQTGRSTSLFKGTFFNIIS